MSIIHICITCNETMFCFQYIELFFIYIVLEFGLVYWQVIKHIYVIRNTV